jgi:dipeptidyl aminopeptidase/acylaminoacyl peptidase
MARFVTVAAFTCVALSTAGAQAPFTFDQARRLVGMGGVDVSPDGKTAVFVVSRPNFTTNQNEATLFAVDLAGGAPRALTPSRKIVGAPHWSPDGHTVAFLAPDTASHMQLWLLPMNGGEARQLTTHPTGVAQFSWRPDGKAIAYGADDEAPKVDGEAKFKTTFSVGAQDMFLRQAVAPQHIWIIPTDGGDAKRLTSGAWTLEFVLPPGSPPSGLSWSPDGTDRKSVG